VVTLSNANTHDSAKENGGRAKPGLRSLLVLMIMALVLTSVVIWRIDRPNVSPASGAHYSYGGLPGWLPKSSTPTNEVLHASAQRPQLAIEGDVVHVALSSGDSTTVMMVGPQTPPFVAPPPPSTTATLSMTLSDTTGAVALRARDFALIDGNGRTYHPATFVGGRSSVLVTSGVTTSVRVREFMAVGSGSIRWAPAGHPVVTWEFTVEND
jgi:hypothetical protein